MLNITRFATAGNKAHGNLYHCEFLLFHNYIEINVLVKRLVYRDSCTSVVPNTSAQIETISEINTFRIKDENTKVSLYIILNYNTKKTPWNILSLFQSFGIWIKINWRQFEFYNVDYLKHHDMTLFVKKSTMTKWHKSVWKYFKSCTFKRSMWFISVLYKKKEYNLLLRTSIFQIEYIKCCQNKPELNI